jgi:2-succinyl-6-hydroxy-2,4-cyclohexadiene-1-carboxylate synthase
MVRRMDPVVALHGFAGTGATWDGVAGVDLAPDLPGHGAAAEVRPVSFAGCVESVLAAAPERFVLAGYSMGGRVALHVALAAPERVSRLVLVATTAGIEGAAERAERRHADEALAAEVEDAPIAVFADRWMALPLFAGDPPAVREVWRRELLRQDPRGLAAALRGIGTGAMDPLWHRLGELTTPATVLAGERDAKFVALGERLAAGLGTSLVVVPGAGHGLPREAPDAVAAAIASP